MRNPKHLSSIAQAVIAVCLLSVSGTAFAYLDPTTGSMVVSAIVGIIASIALAVKTYWYRIKGFFKRNSERDSTSQNTPE
jgi:O-antigen/teichoic acid export membrane protein